MPSDRAYLLRLTPDRALDSLDDAEAWVPQITREWQDRKLEQELKQSLLEEISNSSTTAAGRASRW